jgi:hypothetical protein
MRVVPKKGQPPPPGMDGFLAYVQRFDLVSPSPDPDSGLYRVRRAWRSNNTIMGDVIPLDRLRAHIELTPRFGKSADSRLTKENSMHYSEEFWLDKYFTKQFFFALSQ